MKSIITHPLYFLSDKSVELTGEMRDKSVRRQPECRR